MHLKYLLTRSIFNHIIDAATSKAVVSLPALCLFHNLCGTFPQCCTQADYHRNALRTRQFVGTCPLLNRGWNLQSKKAFRAFLQLPWLPSWQYVMISKLNVALNNLSPINWFLSSLSQLLMIKKIKLNLAQSAIFVSSNQRLRTPKIGGFA